jgi:hypothetical protein
VVTGAQLARGVASRLGSDSAGGAVAEDEARAASEALAALEPALASAVNGTGPLATLIQKGIEHEREYPATGAKPPSQPESTARPRELLRDLELMRAIERLSPVQRSALRFGLTVGEGHRAFLLQMLDLLDLLEEHAEAQKREADRLEGTSSL